MTALRQHTRILAALSAAALAACNDPPPGPTAAASASADPSATLRVPDVDAAALARLTHPKAKVVLQDAGCGGLQTHLSRAGAEVRLKCETKDGAKVEVELQDLAPDTAEELRRLAIEGRAWAEHPPRLLTVRVTRGGRLDEAASRGLLVDVVKGALAEEPYALVENGASWLKPRLATIDGKLQIDPKVVDDVTSVLRGMGYAPERLSWTERDTRKTGDTGIPSVTLGKRMPAGVHEVRIVCYPPDARFGPDPADAQPGHAAHVADRCLVTAAGVDNLDEVDKERSRELLTRLLATAPSPP